MQWELESELLSACEKGDLDTVRRLSGEFAVSHVRDRRGWRLLHFAARSVDNYIAEIQNCIFNTQVIKILNVTNI